MQKYKTHDGKGFYAIYKKRKPLRENAKRCVSSDSYDLTFSIKKTEVVYQPAPGKTYKEPSITVKGQILQVHLPWKHNV